jgi:hypothetical protein
LILRERFCREKIQRACVGVFQNCVQHRQVVAKRLAGSGGRHNHNIFPGMHRRGGRRLVRVKAAYAFCGISGDEVPVNPLRKAGPLRFSRGELTNGGQNFAFVIASRKGVKHFVDARDGR